MTDLTSLQTGDINPKLLQIIKDHIGLDFKIDKIDGYRVHLKRLRRSHCEICDKTHDNEDAYCTIEYDRVYLGCWGRTEKYLLGVEHQNVSPLQPCKPEWKPRQLTNDPLCTVTYNEQVRYVELRHILTNRKQATIIGAVMGSGKTRALIEFLNTLHSDTRVIVIASRRTFARSVTNEFNQRCTKMTFACYLDADNVRDCTQLVIQVESLWKLLAANKQVRSFDVVIIDECESVFTQVVSTGTNKDNIIDNQMVFEYLLKQSRKCFFMDAFLQDRTFRVVKTLNIPYTYFHYLRRPVARTAVRFDSAPITGVYSQKRSDDDLAKFICELISRLLNGKRIYMFCSSQNTLHRIVTTVEVTKGLEDINILEYHGQKANRLDNIRDDWKDANLVITTSSITIGCNFDIAGIFDEVFIYASAASQNLVRDIFQAHMRVRHLNDNRLSYFLDPKLYGCEPYMSRTAIEQRWLQREEYIDGILKVYDRPQGEISDLWRDLFIDAQEERNHSCTLLQPMFLYYLRELNYDICSVNQEGLILEEDRVNLKFMGKIPYFEIPELTSVEYRNLHRQNTDSDPSTPQLTSIQQLSIDKYYFDACIRDIQDINAERLAGIWNVYQQIGREKFINCRYELGISKGLLTLQDILNEGRGVSWNKGFELKYTVIHDICRLFKFKNTLEPQEITREYFNKVINSVEFAQLIERGRNAFKIYDRSKSEGQLITDTSTRKAIPFIHKCIELWSGGGFKAGPRRVKQVNLVRKDVAGMLLTPIDLGLINDLAPRLVREEETLRLTTYETTHDLKLSQNNIRH